MIHTGAREMMKAIFPLIVAVAMNVAAVLSAPAAAEDAPRGMGRSMPVFADCDLNDDGRITEDEFIKARSERIAKRAKEGRQMRNVANAPSFQDIDTDEDGAISRDEFAAHQAEHKAIRGQR
jgi:hypothetical protein